MKGLTLPVLLTIGILAAGCSLDPALTEFVNRIDLHSSYLDEDMKVFVQIPDEYPSSSKSYPVIYILDGQTFSTAFFEKITQYIRNGKIQPMIAVSITYSNAAAVSLNRIRDFTPTYSPSYGESGGLSQFFQFLEHELIPTIDSTYRAKANADSRALFGHSLSGLVSVYGFLNKYDLIHHYTAADPSVWWDDGIFFNTEKDFSQTTGNTAAFLSNSMTISITANTMNEPGFAALITSFKDNLLSRNYTNVSVYFQYMTGHSHLDSAPGAFEFSLTNFFTR